MVVSVAKRRERTEAEVDEAHDRFKLAWKEANHRHWGKQEPGPKRKWVRDVFGNLKKLIEYLKTGTLPQWADGEWPT